MSGTYLKRPRDKGYTFQITVPTPLVGKFKSRTGRPLHKIVEGLNTDSPRQAKQLAAERHAHWLQVFERARHDTPITLGEINDEAMEAYRVALSNMVSEASLYRDIFGDDKTWLQSNLKVLEDALAASDFDLVKPTIEAIERRKGLTLDPESSTYAILAGALLRAQIAAATGRLKALDGETSEPPANLLGQDGVDLLTLRPAKLTERRSIRLKTEHGPWALFEQWVTEAKPAAATINRWRTVFLDLEAKFGQRMITEDDAREWARALVTSDRSADTVMITWLTAARRIYRWAVEQRLINSNPFQGIKISVPKKAIIRDKAFTDAEAVTILRAAMATEPGKNVYKGAQRWVPWLCAYSGARAGEITQLRGVDIETRGNLHVMKITPEAGSVKTNVFRLVPLHEHLITQGFLDFVKARGQGPLFYNPDPAKDEGEAANPKRPRAVKTRERLAAWVRALGITDKGVRPNHAWRHTFKQIAERVGISERISDAITGHAPTTVGRAYGRPTVEDMADALTKFPRYNT